MIYFYLYLLGNIEKIQFVLEKLVGLGFIVLGLAVVVSLVERMINYEGDKDPNFKPKYQPKKWHIAIWFFLWFTSMLLPTEKALYLMGGFMLGEKVVNSEMAEKFSKVLNAKADKYLEEINPQVPAIPTTITGAVETAKEVINQVK